MDHVQAHAHTRLEDLEHLLRQAVNTITTLREEQMDFRREFQEFRAEQQEQTASSPRGRRTHPNHDHG